eukprot:11440136-Alexandrium_andersonii.AAC.1
MAIKMVLPDVVREPFLHALGCRRSSFPNKGTLPRWRPSICGMHACAHGDAQSCAMVLPIIWHLAVHFPGWP